MKNLSEDIPTAAEEVDGCVETDQTECLQLLVGVDAHQERIDRFLVAEVPAFPVLICRSWSSKGRSPSTR